MILKFDLCKILLIQKNFYSKTNLRSIQHLKSKFSKFNEPNFYERIVNEDEKFSKFKRASVLIPISIKEVPDKNGTIVEKTFFTFSKRTERLRSFSGQVCFMGGRRDETDKDDIETAFREAKEEVNIDSKSLTFLAQLCPVLTYNHILVTPVVAFFDKSNYEPILNKQEVEMVFELPTERFLSLDDYEMKHIQQNNEDYYVHYFKNQINGKVITTWGFTAFLSIVISSVLHSKVPDFKLLTNKNLANDNLNQFLHEFSLNILKVFI